ncbi:MAG TPA: bifunctional sulfate adenylyltransferase/adenylylsulfate kinase [Thermoanaerobaculia bacterium]|nr:bifunctional sulfate adenylyltransferase/adenylylsulfate kinase [Thermoanaerobaculia bacterium]
MADLIAPFGGRLVDLTVPEAERPALLARASALPSLTLTPRNLNDLELLATGAFSPLATFLGRADYDRVLSEMRLSDGTLWPIPVTLAVPDDLPLSLDGEIALRDAKHEILAVLTVREIWGWDRRREAACVLGKADPAHPLVREMAGWGARCVSGPLYVLRLPQHVDFQELRLPPAGVRARLAALGNANVVAFQTRNPMHRSHEELTKRAAAECGGTLLIHPVVGLTKPGDVDHFTRVRVYEALLEKHYDPSRTMLALLPLAMRLAGPREAVWHAIIRRNYGANHFIVGRDHAGPGNGSDGKPFFGPQDALELMAKHEAETGVKMIPFREMVYLPDEDRYEEADRVPDGVRTLSISGTEVREAYLATGKILPPWFTRPETAAILRQTSPARHEQGFCVWFTGLSCSGKSTTAELVADLLLERGRRVTLLDGDVVRTHLSKGLGFSREDRDTNIRRIGYVASEIVRHNGVAVCAAISPYRITRAECRAMVGAGNFLEVFVDTPLEVCAARDTKGMYALARAGKLAGFTGVDDPYEPPESPEMRLTTTEATALENARRILAELTRRGFLR